MLRRFFQSKLIRLKSVFFDLLFLSIELFFEWLNFPIGLLISLLEVILLVIKLWHLCLDLSHLLLLPILLFWQLQLMLQLLNLLLHPLHYWLHVIDRWPHPATTPTPTVVVVLWRSTREGVSHHLNVSLQPIYIGLLLPYLVFLLVDLALQCVDFVF